jgi:hypothetical protein
VIGIALSPDAAILIISVYNSNPQMWTGSPYTLTQTLTGII